MVVVVFAVLTEVLAGAYEVTRTSHSTSRAKGSGQYRTIDIMLACTLWSRTFFGHCAEDLPLAPLPFESLRTLARATRSPLFGNERDKSRLAVGLLALIWMGVNPAGAGTVVVPDAIVVYDVSVVTIMEVEVGASTVMVFKTVLISVKLS